MNNSARLIKEILINLSVNLPHVLLHTHTESEMAELHVNEAGRDYIVMIAQRIT